MDAKGQLLWYGIAIILFVLAAIVPVPENRYVRLGWAGLVAFTIPLFWAAWKAV
jgi:hypothetical protein